MERLDLGHLHPLQEHPETNMSRPGIEPGPPASQAFRTAYLTAIRNLCSIFYKLTVCPQVAAKNSDSGRERGEHCAGDERRRLGRQRRRRQGVHRHCRRCYRWGRGWRGVRFYIMFVLVNIFSSSSCRISDPHWFNADPDTDPDPAFFLIADPDSGSPEFRIRIDLMRIRIRIRIQHFF